MAQRAPDITIPETVTPNELVRARSSRELFWARFVRDRTAVGGMVFISVLVILAIFAPLVARIVGHSPNQLFGSMLTSLGLPKGPNAHFWFGADQAGRDVFVRTLYGARTSLTVSVVGTGAATVLGTITGSVAGYYGGWVDTAISRFIDIILSLPLLLFAIGLSSVCSVSTRGCLGGVLKPGLSLVMAIIAVLTWPYLARIVRGQVIALKQRDFAEAARALGASDRRIMFIELLPNLVAPIVVYATLTLPTNILFEASLSYLGVGVPQSTPSWGRMLSDATSGSLFTYAWWMMLYPGLFLLLATLAFNLVGDGLRDALLPESM